MLLKNKNDIREYRFIFFIRINKTNGIIKIIDDLADSFYQKKVPMITCPKTFCGCGMCITKTSKNIDEMFNRHTIDELNYEVVSQKESNWYTDITIK